MASAPPGPAPSAAAFQQRLIGVIDSVPQTSGIGVALIDGGRLYRLRNPEAGEATVVFERRPRPRHVSFLSARPVAKGASRSGPTEAGTHAAGHQQRNAGTSPTTE